MRDVIENLKKKYNSANESERQNIDNKMEELSIENPLLFSEIMMALAHESNNFAEELLLKQKLEDVLPIISVSYLSKRYFKKSPQWFYQRLNGNIVNGKVAKFTTNEKITLSQALREIGHKLSESATIIS
jgi:hypothetical protein